MASSLLVPTLLSFSPPHFRCSCTIAGDAVNLRFSRARILELSSFLGRFHHLRHQSYSPLGSSLSKSGNCLLVARVSGDDGLGGYADASPQLSERPEIMGRKSGSITFDEEYVASYVRMLGLDRDPLDREQAILALWEYSLLGKKCIDAIMQFHGCVNLTVHLLESESSSACEAAAGLLSSISSVDIYRDYVAEAGAIEEIIGLLTRAAVDPQVKEQSLCTLSNLSSDEKYRLKIADADFLQVLVNSLDDEDMGVKEAAGGLLSTLALSPSSHDIMVELGVISKLAALFKTKEDGFRVIKKAAKNALLELAKNDYYRILIIEEGLLPVPIIGEAAYKSFRPSLYSWPSLPDGTEIERIPKGEQTPDSPSRFGAARLLLGLNVTDNLEEAKTSAMAARAQQHFLARIGAIELDDEGNLQPEHPSETQLTLLPCLDGIARLVLILGLEDEAAISKAAESIADSCINEYMRESFKEAGAVKLLIQLFDRNNDSILLAVTSALERLSLSTSICQIMETEGVIRHLVNSLKKKEIPVTLLEKSLNLLARILDPGKEMKSKFNEGPVNESPKSLETTRAPGYSGLSMGDTAEIACSEAKYRKDVEDPSVISRLVEIMKASSRNLQLKAASVLEFVTLTDPSLDTILSANIESGLEAIFEQKIFNDVDSDAESEQPEMYALEIEEAGRAVSAASRLLIKLLESEQFCERVNSARFTELLRKTLRSAIPIGCKDWVAACLVKLSSMSKTGGFEDPITTEVTLYETIPRLIQQLKEPFSVESKESAVVELNRIVSEGVVDSTRAIASEGGIFPLVRLLEEGSERASEAALAILYSLSMDGENHPAITSAGAAPVLKRIVLSQRPQWTRALRLLRNLPV